MAINLERFISNACCNSCQSFYDHYVEANVRFRSALGMNEVIIRRQVSNCCDWCASKAGIFDANKAPSDIYMRHENCRCLVTYKTEKGYQNVWNKKIYKTQKEARVDKIKELPDTITDKTSNKQKAIISRLIKSAVNGAGDGRRDEFGYSWSKGSFKEIVRKFAPNAKPVFDFEHGKAKYHINGNRYSVVYDLKGNYFRIVDEFWSGKNKFVGLNGENMNNVTVNGKTKGRSHTEYQAVTHFINTDKEVIIFL